VREKKGIFFSFLPVFPQPKTQKMPKFVVNYGKESLGLLHRKERERAKKFLRVRHGIKIEKGSRIARSHEGTYSTLVYSEAGKKCRVRVGRYDTRDRRGQERHALRTTFLRLCGEYPGSSVCEVAKVLNFVPPLSAKFKGGKTIFEMGAEEGIYPARDESDVDELVKIALKDDFFHPRRSAKKRAWMAADLRAALGAGKMPQTSRLLAQAPEIDVANLG
jgi:hypothetical protein